MKLLKGIWIGFWSGFILAGVLRWLEALTGKQVYSLLLNIDFLPFVTSGDWSETGLFVLHIGLSVVIGIVYVFLAKRQRYTFGQLFLISFLVGLPFFLLYFPLAALAVEPLVSPLDLNAFLYWTFGHFTFILALPVLYKLFERENAASQ
ncbi:hypothetical protein [Planococcus lenghuensis]|uniref:DUF1440 domain-containing protein n=1 Tax=Planococcus lenghuensis TaxID=2213202 RepID=A0A1Q2L0A8_9BACL|nr:hypothetical protein [Planococcus lenghuensis]AQQ53836.1 hypothetical protein B0X71_12550 [Planococcus lenghuensis]